MDVFGIVFQEADHESLAVFLGVIRQVDIEVVRAAVHEEVEIEFLARFSCSYSASKLDTMRLASCSPRTIFSMVAANCRMAFSV